MHACVLKPSNACPCSDERVMGDAAHVAIAPKTRFARRPTPSPAVLGNGTPRTRITVKGEIHPMKKVSSKAASNKVRELEPFDKRSINLAKFKPDLSAKDFKELFGPIGDIVIFPFLPIETLSCTKTIGRGRTNLTIIVPTIVQVDAATPRASFDRRATPSRNPIIQMHFEPSAYGITSVATYIMEFTIETFGQSTFNLSGFAGPGTLANNGTKVLNGQVRVSLVMQNVPPSQQTFGFLEQTAGGAWNWFSTQVRFPPIVLTQ